MEYLLQRNRKNAGKIRRKWDNQGDACRISRSMEVRGFCFSGGRIGLPGCCRINAGRHLYPGLFSAVRDFCMKRDVSNAFLPDQIHKSLILTGECFLKGISGKINCRKEAVMTVFFVSITGKYDIM